MSRGRSVLAPDPVPLYDAAPGEPSVRGFLHRAAGDASGGMVLTHGAGSDCNAPLLVGLAERLAARGLNVLRCDLPYRQARRTGPPRPGEAARDRSGIGRAVGLMKRLDPGRVSLGGSSYGGRQASMVAADEPGLAAGLLLLSYPLHPPGRPARLRTSHFGGLRTPAFFVHGSADPFGTLEELEAARALIPARTGLLAIDGAGHGLGAGARASRPAAAVVERIAAGFLTFIDDEEDGHDR